MEEERNIVVIGIDCLGCSMVLLIATERLIEPSDPALVMLVALVHHGSILLALLSYDIKLAQYSSSSQPLDIVHASFHESLELDSGRIIVVITEN